MNPSRPVPSAAPATAASLLALVLLAACAGDGSTLPPADPGGPEPAFPPTFSNIQSNVFTPICAVSGCHTTVDQAAGLDLTAGAAYGNLVSVASAEVPALLRVKPSDPAGSYLMMKLDGSAGIVEQRMPLGQPQLSPEIREAIRQWILEGAPNN